jgi:hypothetical protein
LFVFGYFLFFSQILIRPLAWVEKRRQYLKLCTMSVAYSTEHVDLQMSRDFLRLANLLQSAEVTRYFYIDKKQRRYYCFDCQLECRDHDFDGVRSVADFQARVPLRAYDAFWSEYWQDSFPQIAGTTWPNRIPYFAQTSGTSTGRTKYIPISREMLRSNTRAGLDILVHHVANRPKSRVLGGKNFLLGGSIALEELAHGILGGDLTGIARREVPSWGERYVFPDEKLAREEDWERKIEITGRASLNEDIRTLAGTPSWVLLFLERLAALADRPKRLVELYPNLELVVHGGLSFRPYRALYEEWLEGGHAELREVYPASEGFVAVADRGPQDGLRMLLDIGLFYEFVPVEELDRPNPTRHWIATAERERDYAIVLTSCAGVWGYLLGDTVRLVSLNPPRLMVTGRTAYFLSAFGEHLTGEEIERAVFDAGRSLGAEVVEFSVGALFPDADDARGRHLFIVEPRDPAALRGRAPALAAEIDRRLAELNSDYETHRADDLGMAPPSVIVVEKNCFADWMRARGRFGGQNKVPRVINDADLLANLRAHVAAYQLATS